jgi:hypothetical protein
MFERLKDCADRINDQLDPTKRVLAADPLSAIAPLAPARRTIRTLTLPVGPTGNTASSMVVGALRMAGDWVLARTLRARS